MPGTMLINSHALIVPHFIFKMRSEIDKETEVK